MPDVAILKLICSANNLRFQGVTREMPPWEQKDLWLTLLVLVARISLTSLPCSG